MFGPLCVGDIHNGGFSRDRYGDRLPSWSWLPGCRARLGGLQEDQGSRTGVVEAILGCSPCRDRRSHGRAGVDGGFRLDRSVGRVARQADDAVLTDDRTDAADTQGDMSNLLVIAGPPGAGK